MRNRSSASSTQAAKAKFVLEKSQLDGFSNGLLDYPEGSIAVMDYSKAELIPESRQSHFFQALKAHLKTFFPHNREKKKQLEENALLDFNHAKTIKRNLFSEFPHSSQIEQGEHGHCFMASALMAIADRNPLTLLHHVRDNGNNTVDVLFYDENGEPIIYRVRKIDIQPLISGEYHHSAPWFSVILYAYGIHLAATLKKPPSQEFNPIRETHGGVAADFQRTFLGKAESYRKEHFAIVQVQRKLADQFRAEITAIKSELETDFTSEAKALLNLIECYETVLSVDAAEFLDQMSSFFSPRSAIIQEVLRPKIAVETLVIEQQSQQRAERYRSLATRLLSIRAGFQAEYNSLLKLAPATNAKSSMPLMGAADKLFNNPQLTDVERETLYENLKAKLNNPETIIEIGSKGEGEHSLGAGKPKSVVTGHAYFLRSVCVREDQNGKKQYYCTIANPWGHVAGGDQSKTHGEHSFKRKKNAGIKIDSSTTFTYAQNGKTDRYESVSEITLDELSEFDYIYVGKQSDACLQFLDKIYRFLIIGQNLLDKLTPGTKIFFDKLFAVIANPNIPPHTKVRSVLLALTDNKLPLRNDEFDKLQSFLRHNFQHQNGLTPQQHNELIAAILNQEEFNHLLQEVNGTNIETLEFLDEIRIAVKEHPRLGEHNQRLIFDILNNPHSTYPEKIKACRNCFQQIYKQYRSKDDLEFLKQINMVIERLDNINKIDKTKEKRVFKVEGEPTSRFVHGEYFEDLKRMTYEIQTELSKYKNKESVRKNKRQQKLNAPVMASIPENDTEATNAELSITQAPLSPSVDCVSANLNATTTCIEPVTTAIASSSLEATEAKPAAEVSTTAQATSLAKEKSMSSAVLVPNVPNKPITRKKSYEFIFTSGLITGLMVGTLTACALLSLPISLPAMLAGTVGIAVISIGAGIISGIAGLVTANYAENRRIKMIEKAYSEQKVNHTHSKQRKPNVKAIHSQQQWKKELTIKHADPFVRGALPRSKDNEHGKGHIVSKSRSFLFHHDNVDRHNPNDPTSPKKLIHKRVEYNVDADKLPPSFRSFM